MYCLNEDKLKKKIVECGMTQEGLAITLGVNRSTFFRRIKGKKLLLDDVHKICESLKLSPFERAEIFFSE